MFPAGADTVDALQKIIAANRIHVHAAGIAQASALILRDACPVLTDQTAAADVTRAAVVAQGAACGFLAWRLIDPTTIGAQGSLRRCFRGDWSLCLGRRRGYVMRASDSCKHDGTEKGNTGGHPKLFGEPHL